MTNPVMKIKKTIVWIQLLSLIFLVEPFAYSKPLCVIEENHQASHWTQNMMGKSSYHCQIANEILQILIKSNVISQTDKVFDFGAGYGCVSYELANLGFNKLIASDLETKNLQCLKQHLNSHALSHNLQVQLLQGDIINDGQYKKIENNSLGLVYARHVIHFMTANDIIQLIQVSHVKLRNNGILVLEYENNKREPLAEMIETLDDAIKKNAQQLNPQLPTRNIIKTIYGQSGCSFDDYLNANEEYRMPGFPCQLHTFMKTTHQPVMYHYLDQKLLIKLLTKLNFKIIDSTLFNNELGTGFIFAQKRSCGRTPKSGRSELVVPEAA